MIETPFLALVMNDIYITVIIITVFNFNKVQKLLFKSAVQLKKSSNVKIFSQNCILTNNNIEQDLIICNQSRHVTS